MFGFFIGEEFKGFWANKPNDIFYDLTLEGMGWENAELYYYPQFRPNENTTVTKLKATSKDEEDNIVQEIEAVPYVVNGEKLQEC